MRNQDLRHQAHTARLTLQVQPRMIINQEVPTSTLFYRRIRLSTRHFRGLRTSNHRHQIPCEQT